MHTMEQPSMMGMYIMIAIVFILSGVLFATRNATAYATQCFLRYIKVLRNVFEGYLCNGAFASHLDILLVACVCIAYACEGAALLEGV